MYIKNNLPTKYFGLIFQDINNLAMVILTKFEYFENRY